VVRAASATRRIDDLVWARANRDPAAPAVIDGDRTMSYGELTARADRAAVRLRAAGVGSGVPVGLLLDRSAEFVVGAASILRAGGACLLLSPGDPPQRVAALLEAARPPVVLTRDGYRATLPSGQAEVLDIEEADAGGPVSVDGGAGDADDLAFIMATSGSTGAPKGVRITHANYTGQLGWISANLGLRAEDRVLLKAPVSFVSMLRQLVWPLAAGACLVVVPPGAETDVAAMCRLIDRHRVSWMTFISPALNSFLRHASLSGTTVRNVLSGGDRFPPGMARSFFEVFPGARLHHTYGMTEAILVSCAHLAGPDADERTMGPVLPGATALVLDEDLAPVPVGAVGEVYVGGVSLSPGYAGSGDLDEQRFVRPACAGGQRLFATRDRARRRADGTFELVGRSDDVVKVRGFRVDLGEIEHALAAHPAAVSAVCRAEPAGGDARITAFLVPSSSVPRPPVSAGGPSRCPSDRELRDFLRRRLPDYMIPARYLWVESVPLTANGKIDRDALPAAPWPTGGTPAPRQGSGGSLADRIRAAWWSALANGSPEREDDFIAAGGTSLSAVDLARRLSVELGVEAPVSVVLYQEVLSLIVTAGPSLAELVDAVDAVLRDPSGASEMMDMESSAAWDAAVDATS
jgi:amino acid adenylation domain-containing protein